MDCIVIVVVVVVAVAVEQYCTCLKLGIPYDFQRLQYRTMGVVTILLQLLYNGDSYRTAEINTTLYLKRLQYKRLQYRTTEINTILYLL